MKIKKIMPFTFDPALLVIWVEWWEDIVDL